MANPTTIEPATVEELQKIADTPLFDTRGGAWKITKQRQRQLFGSKDIYIVEKLRPSSEELLSTIFQQLLRSAFHKWINDDVRPFLADLAKDADPLIRSCIEGGERDFRKEFVTKLGAQGKAVWKRILDEQMQEIGKLSGQDKTSRDIRSFTTSLILPPQTRLYRSVAAGKSLCEFFCFEYPPQQRIINIYGYNAKLAFPWLVFLVGFVNKELGYMPWTQDGAPRSYAGSRAFWVFYRSGPIQSENDQVALPNIPNGSQYPPYSWCLGTEMPRISLQDTLWHQKIFRWFWDSSFNQWHYPDSRWVISFEEWRKISAKNPDQITELPWEKLPVSLGSFIDNMAKEFDNQKGGDILYQQEQRLAEKKDALTQKFRERLEEELFFLGSRLIIPAETRAKALEFLQKRLQEGTSKLDVVLKEIGDNLGKKVTAKLLEKGGK